MDIEESFELEHLFLTERKCRSCGKKKDLLSDFYRTRRDRTSASAYSYECKKCTKKRILKTRKVDSERWEYPDW